MKKGMIVLATCLLLSGCGSNSKKEESKDGKPIEFTTSETKEDSNKDSKRNETANKTEENTLDDLIAQKQQAGMVVVAGTIKTFSFDELLAYQGNQNVGYTSDETFYMLMLDAPQSIEFMAGDGKGMRTGNLSMIKLSGGNAPSYVGEHVTVAMNPNKTWFPSDVSLPLGEPRSDEYEILGS